MPLQAVRASEYTMRMRSPRRSVSPHQVLLAALCSLACVSSARAQAAAAEPRWQLLHERAGTSLRALAVVDASVVWAGGTGGTVLRTVDGGRAFRDVAPTDCDACDFRDLHAFGPERAVAMVAGQPARIYRTADGGASWSRVHEDPDAAAFFDTIEFDGDLGFLFGDPLGGEMYVRRSDDAGASWRRVAGLPAPLPDEAGFAASGTCVSVGGSAVRIVTGGGASRCVSSTDGGVSFRAAPLPLLQGSPSQGAFGVAFRGELGIAVGGDYREPARADGTAAWTDDGGRAWHASSALGYRSAVTWLDDGSALAVGPLGASITRDGGRTWSAFGETGFHAVARGSDGSVFACGSDGRIARLLPAREFAVMKLFGDHMVLPPGETVAVRGFGPAGAKVRVAGSWGEALECTIGADERWRGDLPTPGRGGPHAITLTCGGERIVLDDVLVGDVWLCSGQSNMEMPVGHQGGWKLGVDDWEREVANANHPELRVFTVGKATSGTPLDDVEGEWQVCTPETAGSFSAAGYFFALELLDRGPIGLVVSSWGGTVCEAWTSPAALAEFPEFADALAATRAPAMSRTERRDAFWRAVPPEPLDGGWKRVSLPGLWSQQGLARVDGVAFYRRAVALPEAMRGQDLVLELGAIDDMDTTWCNGVRVGGMEDNGAWSTPRRYAVPANVTAGRERVDILVRVVDTGGEGGFSASPETMQLRAADGSAAVGLAGETWYLQLVEQMKDLPPWPRGPSNSPNRPAVLYHAMIAPLVPFPFTGALWYQGESNRNRAEQYARLFPAMIRDWRRIFARKLPFLFVQIAPFGYGEPDGGAALRLAQAAALELPHTGMVVTLDIGDARDIHPRNKQEVGRRLALHALRGVYGEDVVSDGPTPRGVERAGDGLRVTFDGAHGGLLGDAPLLGFEVAGADGAFAAASARIDGEAVVVRCDAVAEPRHVRYAWGAVPPASLKNGAGLPAGPFRLSVPR